MFCSYNFKNTLYHNHKTKWEKKHLTLSWRRSLSYKNQSIDLQRKSMDWFLYDRDLRHERVKRNSCPTQQKKYLKGTNRSLKLKFMIGSCSGNVLEKDFTWRHLYYNSRIFSLVTGNGCFFHFLGKNSLMSSYPILYLLIQFATKKEIYDKK